MCGIMANENNITKLRYIKKNMEICEQGIVHTVRLHLD